MHATTIAPQHAAALHTCIPPSPPPSWRRSDERRRRCRRFARTGAETFSESGTTRTVLMRTSRTPPPLSLSLSAVFYNHRLHRNCFNDTLTTRVFSDSARFSRPRDYTCAHCEQISNDFARPTRISIVFLAAPPMRLRSFFILSFQRMIMHEASQKRLAKIVHVFSILSFFSLFFCRMCWYFLYTD